MNHASRRVLEKAGLSYVRTINADNVEYALMRSNWKGG